MLSIRCFSDRSWISCETKLTGMLRRWPIWVAVSSPSVAIALSTMRICWLTGSPIAFSEVGASGARDTMASMVAAETSPSSTSWSVNRPLSDFRCDDALSSCSAEMIPCAKSSWLMCITDSSVEFRDPPAHPAAKRLITCFHCSDRLLAVDSCSSAGIRLLNLHRAALDCLEGGIGAGPIQA